LSQLLYDKLEASWIQLDRHVQNLPRPARRRPPPAATLTTTPPRLVSRRKSWKAPATSEDAITLSRAPTRFKFPKEKKLP